MEKIAEQSDAIQQQAENLRQRLDRILDAEMSDDVPLRHVSSKSEARAQAFSSRKNGANSK